MPDLNPKRRLFVSEYLTDLNAGAAYIRAGYVAKTQNVADVQGHKLLRNAKIASEIQEAIKARESRTLITGDKALQELAYLGFSNMDDYASWGPTYLTLKESEDLTRAQKAAVVEVVNNSVTITRTDGEHTISETKSQVKIKLADKEGPLDKIMKHSGMYPKEGTGGDVNIYGPVQFVFEKPVYDSI